MVVLEKKRKEKKEKKKLEKKRKKKERKEKVGKEKKEKVDCLRVNFVGNGINIPTLVLFELCFSCNHKIKSFRALYVCMCIYIYISHCLGLSIIYSLHLVFMNFN